MLLAGALFTLIFTLLFKWISNKFYRKTNRKQCPKCGSTNITYLGVSRMKRLSKNKKSLIAHYNFQCNKCHWRFEYYSKNGIEVTKIRADVGSNPHYTR